MTCQPYRSTSASNLLSCSSAGSGGPLQLPWFISAIACPSLPPVAALLALPERAERAILACREIFPLLVRAAHVALAHRHRPDAVLLEELLKFLPHLGAGGHVGPDPPLQGRLG